MIIDIHKKNMNDKIECSFCGKKHKRSWPKWYGQHEFSFCSVSCAKKWAYDSVIDCLYLGEDLYETEKSMVMKILSEYL